MHSKYIRDRLAALILGAVALALTGWAMADPPTRVARLGYISGAVSFSPAGEDEWVQGAINRPLISGDRLWVTPGARAELQIGVAAVRMSGSTSVTLLNLDDRVTQLELAQGTLNVRIRRLSSDQVFEIDTPNLAFSLRRPGDYRIDVDPAGDATTVLVRDGQAEVFGEGAAYTIGTRQSYSYYGTGLRDYEYIDQPRVDEFDRWSIDRDRRAEKSVSLRYVSPDVIGYEDLDANGTWRVVAGYGNVWVPSRVATGWAPYRDGHWSWVEPWGWTWVDDAPWGFAVSHYGRWANLSGTWGWVPGPARQQAVYAPALVAFVGGSNFRLSVSSGNVGGVAWFPLGPRDVYRPSYAVSRDYFTRVNTSNTVITTTNVTNVYNNNSTNITYVNQRVPGAVVAVPTTAFVQSQPVSRSAVRLNAEQIVNAPVSAVAAVAPVQRSVIGGAAPTAKPAMNRVERPVVARTAPPPSAVAFAARESALAATPGKPLAPAEVQRLKPGAPSTPAPQVVVAAPVKPAVPMANAAPSKPAPGAGARGEGGPAGQRGRPDQSAPPPDTSVKPQPSPQAAPQPPVAAPAPDSRVPPGQRGRVEPASQPVAPVVKPQPAPPSALPPAPQIAPPAPVAAPAPDSRVPPGQRGRVEPAPQPVAPAVKPQPAPPAAPQPAPQPPAAAPTDQRPAPGQRGRPEPQTLPAAQPQPAPQAPQPMAKPQPAPQAIPQPPAATPAEQRSPPAQRGRPEPQEQPAPPMIKAQPAPPALPPPAATPVEQRTPPGQRGRPEPQVQPAAPAPPSAARPPEQRQAPQPPAQIQPSPTPPAPNAEQRGPASKPGAPKAEDKRSPEQVKQDEQQRQDEEKKGRKPN